MTAGYAQVQARRVVTGVNGRGRSTVVSDELTPTRLVTPGNTKCDLWRMDQLPTDVEAPDGLADGVITSPPTAGLVHRVVAIPPDEEWDQSQGFMDANGPLEGLVAAAESGGIVGLHFTETVDIITVISGELVAVLEDSETTLGPGDTLVQRGTRHTWSNRTHDPAVIVAVMVAAFRG